MSSGGFLGALDAEQPQAEALGLAHLRLEHSGVDDARPLPDLGILITVRDSLSVPLIPICGRDDNLALDRDIVVPDLGEELPLGLLSCLASPLSLALLSNLLSIIVRS